MSFIVIVGRNPVTFSHASYLYLLNYLVVWAQALQTCLKASWILKSSPFIFLMPALDLHCTAKILPAVSATTKHSHIRNTNKNSTIHTFVNIRRSNYVVLATCKITCVHYFDYLIRKKTHKLFITMRSTPTQTCCDARQRRVTAGVSPADTLAPLMSARVWTNASWIQLPRDGAILN